MRGCSIRAVLLLVSSCAVVVGCVDDAERGPMGPDRRSGSGRPDGASAAFLSPLRAVAYDGGSILVTDPLLHKVLGVDPITGRSFEAFPVSGSPLGVAVLGRQILVGNATEGSLQYYDVRGRLRRSTGPGSIGRPSDIAVDPGQGLIFVVDAAAGDVKVFDERARLLRVLCGPGTADDRLTAPVGIAVDPSTQRVLVSDWGTFGSANGGTASLKIFDYDGTFVDLISGRGTCGMLGCSGGFSRPQGLAVDGAGRIYLADALLAQVLVIDVTTKRVTANLGGRPLLRLPTDVVLLGSDVVVTSSRTASVEVVPGVAQP